MALRARNTGTAGFTLLEVLVVLGVFALVGVIASQILTRVLDNERTLAARGERLSEVQRAMQILQRDIMQIAPRGVRDQLGDPVEALLIGADGMMEFTRAGWRNPLGHPRSELQRVGYVLQDGDLFRAYWRTLDRAPDAEPELQRLLSDVEQIEFAAVDVSGNEHGFWPLIGEFREDPATRLAGIVLRIDVAPFGVVERLWMVPDV